MANLTHQRKDWVDSGAVWSHTGTLVNGIDWLTPSISGAIVLRNKESFQGQEGSWALRSTRNGAQVGINSNLGLDHGP